MLFQDGRTVFKNAVFNMADASREDDWRSNMISIKDDIALVGSASSE